MSFDALMVMLNYKGDPIRNLKLALAALLLVCDIAVAQPMADRVPSDAVVYIGWQGSDSLGTPYEKSHLKGVIDSSNIPQFFSEFLPRVIEHLGKDDAQAAGVFRSVHGIGRIFLPKPCEIGRASCREKCRSRWSPYH